MKLKLNGGDFVHESFTLVDDLDNYCSTVEFLTQLPVGDTDYTLEDGDGNFVDMVVKSVTRTNDKNHVILYPKKFQEVLNTTFEAFYGSSTVEDLVQRIGFKIEFSLKTEETFWNIPSCKLTTLMSILTKYTRVSNGGGVRFYVSLLGTLHMVDLKSSFDREPELELDGEVISALFSTEWMLNYSGVINLVKYSVSGVDHERFIIKEGYGSGSYRINISDENVEGLVKQMLENEFYVKYYTTHQIELNVPFGIPAFIGMPVTYVSNRDLNKFIVYSTARGLDDQGHQSLALKLVACPK